MVEARPILAAFFIEWVFLLYYCPMAHSVLLVLKLLSLGFGLFLIISRIFLFEKTQGLIQSRIENLWIRVDDYQSTALTKHLAFMKVVSATASSLLDRLFGPKLLSLQSMTVSVCYAVLTALLILIALIRYGQGYWYKEFLQISFLYWTLGTLPLFFSVAGRAKRKKYLLIWLTFCLTSAWTMIGIPAFNLLKDVHYSPLRFLEVVIIVAYLSIGAALTLYAFFVSLMRRSLRAIRESNSYFRTVSISLLNLLPIIGLYGLLKLLSFKLNYSDFDPSVDYKDPAVLQSVFASWSNRLDIFLVLLLITVFLFDTVFLLTALVFASLTLVMLLHRLFWPILSRLLYASQRFHIVSDGKVLIYIGALFILLGIGKLSWLETVLKLVPR